MRRIGQALAHVTYIGIKDRRHYLRGLGLILAARMCGPSCNAHRHPPNESRTGCRYRCSSIVVVLVRANAAPTSTPALLGL